MPSHHRGDACFDGMIMAHEHRSSEHGTDRRHPPRHGHRRGRPGEPGLLHRRAGLEAGEAERQSGRDRHVSPVLRGRRWPPGIGPDLLSVAEHAARPSGLRSRSNEVSLAVQPDTLPRWTERLTRARVQVAEPEVRFGERDAPVRRSPRVVARAGRDRRPPGVHRLARQPGAGRGADPRHPRREAPRAGSGLDRRVPRGGDAVHAAGAGRGVASVRPRGRRVGPVPRCA